MIAKKIYNDIKTENIEVKREDFSKLPDNISDYTIAYVGKHKAIQPNNNIIDFNDKIDLDPVLLIELRLFTEKEEIFIFSDGERLKQRRVSFGNGDEQCYIVKTIQLRDKGYLVCHHYIDSENGGYDFSRYIKVM